MNNTMIKTAGACGSANGPMMERRGLFQSPLRQLPVFSTIYSDGYSNVHAMNQIPHHTSRQTSIDTGTAIMATAPYKSRLPHHGSHLPHSLMV